jgi:hypothetical protein
VATARKVRQRKFPQADFEIALPAALALLLDPQDVAPGDLWAFSVDGSTLRIARLRPAEEDVVSAPEGTVNGTDGPE